MLKGEQNHDRLRHAETDPDAACAPWIEQDITPQPAHRRRTIPLQQYEVLSARKGWKLTESSSARPLARLLSLSEKKAVARPFFPARPVRPMRWT